MEIKLKGTVILINQKNLNNKKNKQASKKSLR